MLKKYTSYLGILVLACFSFYYTDKATDIIKRNDPIMKNILSNYDKFSLEPVNAQILEDEIIPGINGKKINIDETYKKMKKLENYNETVMTYEEVIPDLTYTDIYDKYIVSGNSLKNEISLVFKINNSNYLENVNKILLDKNTLATFFIDGSVIENNMDKVLELSRNNNEIENLGYDGKYTDSKLLWTNNMIFSLTNENNKYCYTDNKSIEVLNICSSNKMYTIKPTISIENYPFATIKKYLKSGSIIGLDLNETVIKELPSIISYIKQKGYDIVTLKELISEEIVEEK